MIRRAVAIATHRFHAASSPRLALGATTAVVVAGSLAIAWIVLAIGRDSPFVGDFGLVGFWAGLVAWLAVTAFGLVTLRLAMPWRWAGLVLAVGSSMAITGIDHLGLTSAADPSIFTPISLAGLGLAGLGWVFIGAWMVAAPRWRAPGRAPTPAGVLLP